MLKRIRSRVIVFCAAVILTVAQTAPVYAQAAGNTSAGNGNLQAKGFEMDGSTLVRYTGTEKTVSVPASVKRIGEAAFEGNTTMEKLTVPKGVEEISYSAFADCTGLRTVVMSDTVEKIGNSAFSNCSRLININFGKNLRDLGIGVFAGCDALESVTVAKGNKAYTVADGALYNKDKTVLYQVFAGREGESFSMPLTATQIKPYAFWGCNNLKKITISSNLSEISEYAFSNCKALQSIQIPYSVKSIGLKAFEDCVNLKKTVIGPTVSKIHETAFDGCVSLYIEAEEGTAAERFAKEHDLKKTDQVEYEETGNDDKESSSEDAGKDSENQTGESVNREGLLADSYIVGNRAVLFIDNTKAVVHDGSSEAAQPDASGSGGSSGNSENDSSEEGQEGDNPPSPTKGFSIPKLKIADGSKIASQAYYKDTEMTVYEMPGGIKAVGSFSFARSGLQEIDIRAGVTEIEYAAFYHCENLSRVTIPKTVTKIGAKAFEKTLWMDNWKAGSGSPFLTVGDGILLAYRGSGETVKIPEGIKQIAPEAFEGHKEITQLQFPDSLLSIGEKAFFGCTSLERVTGGTSITAICDRAFYNCPIAAVRIPDTVTHIGAGAFAAPDSKLLQAERTVIFHGEKLPVMSFEDSAYRLSDKTARSLAFEGIGTAVIQSATEEFEDTVLDVQELGFRGIICKVTGESDREAVCVGTTLSEEELKITEIPQKIYIYGVPYTLKDTQNIGSLAADRGWDFTYEGKVLFSADCSLFPDETLMSAVLEGNTSEYYLRIRDDEQAKGNIQRAYGAVYKQKLEEGVYGFQMELVEAESRLSIQKLGKQLLEVTLPVPKPLEGKTFRLVCLDEDGQLESIDYTLSEEAETLYLTFELNHLSTFGFYITGEVPPGADRTLATGSLDESPDTGDGLHPVLFLAGGAAFLTIAWILIGNRKKSSGIS